MSEFGDVTAVVIGAGSIGQRHMRNLRSLGVENITAVDPDFERMRPAVDELQVRPAGDVDEALGLNPQVVFVCTPPSMHIEQCAAAVRAGADVFVEKPLSNDLVGIDDLEREARQHARIVQVGYNLRFIPALKTLKGIVESEQLGRPLWARFEVGQYLPDWRPTQDYRLGYTARKELGGGIVLDASHEIDLALWLLGNATDLCCMAGKTSDLQMDVEDTATILLRFESGAQCDVHMDCVQREYSRGLKIAFERGTASWSFPQNVLRIFEVDQSERLIYPPPDYVPNQMYIDEIRDFLCAVRAKADHGSVGEGKNVVRVALAALESAAEQKWVRL